MAQKVIPLLISVSFVCTAILSTTGNMMAEAKKHEGTTASIIIGSPPYYDDWYYYPSCHNYAPSGMPDFDQKQDNWKDPVYHGWTFCGAVSVANILWYIDAYHSDPQGNPGDGVDIFPVVLDYHAQGDSIPGPFSDDHNANNVNDLTSPWDQERMLFGNELIERVAWYVNTNGCRTGDDRIWGTPLLSMHSGVRKWLEDTGLSQFFKVEMSYVVHNDIDNTMLMNPQPSMTAIFENTQGMFFTRKDLACIDQLSTVQEKLTFYSIASKIQNGSFVVLGINGLDDTQRIHFSHWVTVAGVNIPQSQIALSDPYFDSAQATIDPTLHNDAAIVSHDMYTVNTTSPFPEEADYWWLEGYLPNLYSVIPAALIITPITESIPQIPPMSYFIKPDEHYFFINDQHIFSTLFGNTVVIGGITFEANAFSTEGIKSIEFYINDKLQVMDDSFPFEWFWNEPSFGRYIVKIIAVDTVGTHAENKMSVWKFF